MTSTTDNQKLLSLKLLQALLGPAVDEQKQPIFSNWRRRVNAQRALLYDTSPVQLLFFHHQQAKLCVCAGDKPVVAFSSTSVVLLINLMFRCLAHPLCLKHIGDSDSEVAADTWPQPIPNSLPQLLNLADIGKQPPQPQDLCRAHYAKLLAEIALDFYFGLALKTASTSPTRPINLLSMEQGQKALWQGIEHGCDRAMQLAQMTQQQLPVLLEGTHHNEAVALQLAYGDSHASFYSVNLAIALSLQLLQGDNPPSQACVLEKVTQSLTKIHPGGVKTTLNKARNEAKFCLANITGAKPDMDGFNGVLNQQSKQQFLALETASASNRNSPAQGITF